MNHKTETARFILRPYRMEDLEDFFELDNDPEVHKYLGNNPVKERSETIKAIENVLSQYAKNDIGRWSIEDKITGEVMGWTGLKVERKIRDFSYYDIGYRLKRKHWGKGIATETAIASLAYGFNVLNYDKICAAADVNNTGSNKVLSKIGMTKMEPFQFEGTLCNWYECEKKI